MNIRYHGLAFELPDDGLCGPKVDIPRLLQYERVRIQIHLQVLIRPDEAYLISGSYHAPLCNGA